LALVASLSAAACRAGGEGRLRFPRERSHAPRERSFDVLAYGIELEILPEERAIQATCRVRLAPLAGVRCERVVLDLVGLAVAGVSDGEGRALDFEHADGKLAIRLAEPLASVTELEVRYGGCPERGLWFSGTRDDGSGPTQVFSHGETEGSRGWFPCFDEPAERAALEIHVTMPARWIAFAPGRRVEERQLGEKRSELWRMDFPHPSYLASLVAGEFVVEAGSHGALPLLFAAEPRHAQALRATFEETDDVLAFLEDYVGLAYPYEKYSQVAVDNFPWGGMENISATTLTPLLLGDEGTRLDRPPHHLIAHEAAHQWFGDLFTCADWSHLWLNEGFATYFALLYVEHSRGLDEFRAELREACEAYLAGDVSRARRPVVSDRWKEPDDVFDVRPYQGAAARLHLLRSLVGDACFRAGVRAYAARHVGTSVVTADFRRAMEEASGLDLGPFFEQWFLRPGFPELAVDWSWDAATSEVLLEVEQQQDPGDGTPSVFVLPVDVEVCAAGSTRRHRLELDQRRERFRLPAGERPAYVDFDLGGWVPARVLEEKEPAEWRAIAGRSSDVNARREAVLALGRRVVAGDAGEEGSEDLAAVLERLETDASAWVRADAARALAGVSPARAALARAACDDEAPRVRAAALRALAPPGPDADLVPLAERAFYSEPSYAGRGAAAALLCRAAPERAFEFLGAGLEQGSPHDELAAVLLRELALLQDARVPAELWRWAADPSLAPTARAVAVDGLAGTARELALCSRFLVPFLEEPSFHLRTAAVRALARCGDVGARRALRAYYPRARTAEERRVIEALLAGES
jgi:aminopeptidase N